MAENTKACSLTKDETAKLIIWHGSMISLGNLEDRIDRMNYLNRRLKSFDEVEIVKETQPENGITGELKKDGW